MRIAFDGFKVGNRDIYVVPAQGERRACMTTGPSSEVQFQRELADARIARAEDGSKATRADGIHRVVEVRAIEEVEEFCSKLEIESLNKAEILNCREIHLIHSG